MPNRNGPEYLPGYRRLDRHSLFGDKCGGWLAVGAVCCERVFIDFPVNVRVQRCKFTHPDTFRSPETLASNSAWSLAATICDNLQRLGRRAQPSRRRVGRQAARGAPHLCDPVAVERDPVDYGIHVSVSLTFTSETRREAVRPAPDPRPGAPGAGPAQAPHPGAGPR